MQVLLRHVHCASVQPLARCGQPARFEKSTCTYGAPEAAAREFSLPPLLLREFFFEESVGRVVYERLRALEPALGGNYGLAAPFRGPPLSKPRGAGAAAATYSRPAQAASRLQEELPWVACSMGAFPRSHRIAVAHFWARNASG